MNHNTISGNPHDEDLRKLINSRLEISAEEMRAITSKGKATMFYIDKFFKKARMSAKMGVNWIYIFIPDKDIMDYMKSYLERLGYKITWEPVSNYGVEVQQMRVSW